MKCVEDSKDKSRESSFTSPGVDRLATGRDKLNDRRAANITAENLMANHQNRVERLMPYNLVIIPISY